MLNLVFLHKQVSSNSIAAEAAYMEKEKQVTRSKTKCPPTDGRAAASPRAPHTPSSKSAKGDPDFVLPDIFK